MGPLGGLSAKSRSGGPHGRPGTLERGPFDDLPQNWALGASTEFHLSGSEFGVFRFREPIRPSKIRSRQEDRSVVEIQALSAHVRADSHAPLPSEFLGVCCPKFLSWGQRGRTVGSARERAQPWRAAARKKRPSAAAKSSSSDAPEPFAEEMRDGGFVRGRDYSEARLVRVSGASLCILKFVDVGVARAFSAAFEGRCRAA